MKYRVEVCNSAATIASRGTTSANQNGLFAAIVALISGTRLFLSHDFAQPSQNVLVTADRIDRCYCDNYVAHSDDQSRRSRAES